MILIHQTQHYSKWIDNFKDHNAVGRIEIRVSRLSLGNSGDVKPVGEGVSELRIHYGAGYRVYFVNRSGDKTTQTNDIKTAKILLQNCNKEF